MNFPWDFPRDGAGAPSVQKRGHQRCPEGSAGAESAEPGGGLAVARWGCIIISINLMIIIIPILIIEFP